MLYEQFGELKYKFRNREFWCRGYYVDTVGKNESRIAEYIKNQLKEDELGEQLRIPSPSRPGVKFCVSDIRQSQEWHWKAGRILA